jgi:sporulation protein YlmC with PRC-barrel domain
MDLSFGTNVREHGYSIGRLVGIEADRRTRAVRNIIISATGTVDSAAERRPLIAVPADHFDGDIVLRAVPAAEETFAPSEGLMLTSETRLVRGGRQIGRLSGVELSPETGEIVAIVGRQHWWTRHLHLQAPGLDFSVPGEIRVGAATSQAA